LVIRFVLNPIGITIVHDKIRCSQYICYITSSDQQIIRCKGFDSLHILDADTLRDGGTTCVSLEDGQQVQHVTFDYSLPRDGRTRYVYVSNVPFDCNKSNRLDLRSEEERQIVEAIYKATTQEYGAMVVEAFLHKASANPGDGLWFYVFNFLRIAAAERSTYSLLAKSGNLNHDKDKL
jgi:hypothetical protein